MGDNTGAMLEIEGRVVVVGDAVDTELLCSGVFHACPALGSERVAETVGEAVGGSFGRGSDVVGGAFPSS